MLTLLIECFGNFYKKVNEHGSMLWSLWTIYNFICWAFEAKI